MARPATESFVLPNAAIDHYLTIIRPWSHPMQRILIIGPGGAGKSTLARALAAKRNLPVIHLDQHQWLPGWVNMDDDLWHTTVRELTARES